MKLRNRQRGFVRIESAESYVPTLITTLAAASSKTVDEIFHPGHWYIANGEDTLFSAFLTEPKFVGAVMVYRWRNIEGSQGVYDWTHVDARLAQCAAAGKYMSIIIQKSKFGGDPPNTPDYMWTNASYGGDPLFYGNWPKDSHSGWRPFLENANVVNAYNTLQAAAGLRYRDNPWIESIQVDESSLDGPQGDALLEAGFKSICLGARDAMLPAGKHAIAKINFAGYWAADPGESREETACKWAIANGIGIGGPDLKENNALLNAGLYKVCREQHMEVPTAVDVQWADYDPGENVDKTVREILAYGNGEIFGIVDAARIADSPLNWSHAWEPRAPWYSGTPTSPVSGDNVVTVVADAPVIEAELFYESRGQGQYP